MSPIIRGGLRVVGQRQRSAVATFAMYIRRRVRDVRGDIVSPQLQVREAGVPLWWMSLRTAVDKLYLDAVYPAESVQHADTRQRGLLAGLVCEAVIQ